MIGLIGGKLPDGPRAGKPVLKNSSLFLMVDSNCWMRPKSWSVLYHVFELPGDGTEVADKLHQPPIGPGDVDFDGFNDLVPDGKILKMFGFKIQGTAISMRQRQKES